MGETATPSCHITRQHDITLYVVDGYEEHCYLMTDMNGTLSIKRGEDGMGDDGGGGGGHDVELPPLNNVPFHFQSLAAQVS